jgi:hypothetical protein
LLGQSNQVAFLGVSVSEALPQDPAVEDNPYCSAGNMWKEQTEAGVSEKSAKRPGDQILEEWQRDYEQQASVMM